VCVCYHRVLRACAVLQSQCSRCACGPRRPTQYFQYMGNNPGGRSPGAVRGLTGGAGVSMRRRLLSETMACSGSSAGRVRAFAASPQSSPSTAPRVSGSTCRHASIGCCFPITTFELSIGSGLCLRMFSSPCCDRWRTRAAARLRASSASDRDTTRAATLDALASGANSVRRAYIALPMPIAVASACILDRRATYSSTVSPS